MMIRTAVVSCLTYCLFVPLAQGQVVVNEVSASNYSDQADSFGEYEDWIELFNTTGATVDLSGWYLSDSQANNTGVFHPQANHHTGALDALF